MKRLLQNLIVIISVFILAGETQAQVCVGVPTYEVDLTGSVDTVWNSPALIRNGNCCGTNFPDRCVAFRLTLDPGAAGVIFDLTSGAIPSGSLFYQVDCGPETVVGGEMCLSGTGPFNLTFCKPGSNLNTYSITSIPAIAIDVTTTDVNCFNGTNGSISVNPSRGTPPYAFQWSDGATTQNRTNLSAGTYSVTVTGQSMCATSNRSATITISQPPLLNPTAVVTNVPCYGNATGAIDLNISGGVTPYNIQWNDNFPFEDRSALVAGNYSVTVTDAYGCSASVATPVQEPAAPLSTSMTSVPVSCFGGSNGTVTLNVAGGTTPYSFQWSDGATTQNRSGLPIGNYLVTIIDAHGCMEFDAVNITQPVAALNLTGVASNVPCFGGNAGSILQSVTGGTTPYSFNWGDANTQNRLNIPAGNYAVTVTDARMCTTTATYSITQPTALSAMVTSFSNVTCYGFSNGAIDISVNGGVTPYQYSWNDGINTQNRANLAPGNYSVTITDAHTCTATVASVLTVTQPGAPLSTVTTTTDVTCFGIGNGSISLSVAGGTPAYYYQWAGGVTTQNRTNLSPGTYTVSISDDYGCSISATATIQQPASPLNVTGVVNNVNCFGGNTGSITQTVTGGTTPYTFNWGGVTTPNRTNIAAGDYAVTVTDANGCSTTASYIVTQPTALQASVNSSVNVSCYGFNNGSINIGASGGVSPYQFNWNDGTTTQNRTNLAPGNYSVTITDVHSCTASLPALTITQPSAPLAVAASKSDVTCFGMGNGSITLNTSGGTPAYSYQWTGGVTTQNRTNLSPGTYSVTVTDVNSCTVSTSISIQQPVAALNVTGVTNHVSCFGGNTGSITQTVTGGTTPYAFNWGNVNTQNRTNIPAGNYAVTITDAQSCSATANYSITQPSALTASVTASSNVTCYGFNNGSINIGVSGGVNPYQFSWSDGFNTQNRTGLAPANYTLTATDANACTTTVTKNITQPAAALAVTTSVTDVSCFNGNSGAIILNVNGGTAPYSFSWSGGATSQNLSNLVTGNYEVTILDANLCSVATSADVLQPDAALIASCSVTNVTCFGADNGMATVNATGGTPPYIYNWQGGVTIKDRSNLAAGTYPVTVTDTKGCKTNTSALINQPTKLIATATPSDVKCNGESNGGVSLVVNGGTPIYTFKWNNGATSQSLANLGAGTYEVVVRDANNCTAGSSAGVNQPQLLQAIAKTTDVRCYGENSGSISISVTGGITNYQFRWSTNSTNPSLNNIPMGTYTLTVTDANQCTAVLAKTITQPAPLQLIETHTDVLCNGNATGEINLLVTGGAPAYSYAWNNGSKAKNLMNISAGIYTVTVTDKNSCTTTKSVSLAQPTALQVQESHNHISCNGLKDGNINLNITGGVPTYVYNWDNGASTQNLENIAAGVYSVTVTDANGCQKALNAVTLSQPELLSVYVQSTDVACSGEKMGTLTTQVQGGTQPYQYQWNNNLPHTANHSGLMKGSYSVIVYDAKGCMQTAGAVIDSIAPMTLSAYSKPLACAEAKGSIDVIVIGGKQPYVYQWNNGNRDEDLNDIHPGDYYLMVKDASGCILDTTLVLTNLNSFDVTAWGGGTIKLGESVEIFSHASGSDQTTYNWLPAYALECSTCPNTLSRPAYSTLYTVVATDTNGCEAQDTVFVHVISDHGLFNPNAFTPNNDGNNDEYQLFGNIEGIRYIHFMIFDRWGEMIFEATEPTFKWDGTYKGEPVSPSVFVYLMHVAFLDQKETEIHKGSITLIR